MPQEPLLDDLDNAVEIIRARHRQALASVTRARAVEMTCRDTLYAALRRRQAVRVAGEVDAPVPCRDCLTDVAVGSTSGAGAYTSATTRHELMYEGGELPYATCGWQWG